MYVSSLEGHGEQEEGKNNTYVTDNIIPSILTCSFSVSSSSELVKECLQLLQHLPLSHLSCPFTFATGCDGEAADGDDDEDIVKGNKTQGWVLQLGGEVMEIGG